MHQKNFEAIDEGSTVITVNARLARALQAEYGRAAAEAGRATWARPDILSYGAWLQRLWDTAADAGSYQVNLLSRDQELILWERVISEDEAADALLQTPRTARLAAEAWSLSHAWGVELDKPSLLWSDDARAFVRWMDAFNRMCLETGSLPVARLPHWLLEQIRNGAVPIPREIRLAGFDELSPIQHDLVEGLRKGGTTVRDWPMPAADSNPVLLAAADAEDEIRLAAGWARRKLEHARDESVSIGVVVQSLAALRDTAERIFTEEFYPGAVPSDIDPSERAFNLSAGRPLAAYPTVEAAFNTFELARECIPWEEAGRLLRSPFVGGWLAERELRSLLDARIRRRGHLTITRDALRRLAGHSLKLEDGSEHRCEALAGRLNAAVKLLEDQPRKMRPSAWSSLLTRLLQTMSWPGDRAQSSAEYQTMMAWKDVFARLGSLDDLLGEITVLSAIAHLRRMSRETLFQPRGSSAPVQIVGVLEAAGLQFDHLWMAGFHDEAWPEPPSPNPFLPLDQQKSKNVPHASAERELAFAKAVTARLMNAAPDIVISYPSREEDLELRPSRLVKNFPPLTPGDLNLEPVALSSEAVDLERLEDFKGPALGEEIASRGGARVFELQAKCPFRAFAEIRLASEMLEVPAGGFDAREKGTLVHRALELLWEDIGSFEGLQGLQNPEETVTAAVQQAMAERSAENPECYTPRFSAVESERLNRLLLALLELERSRAPFRLDGHELKRDATAGGVTVTTRVDRIDTLEDGRKIYIDYKTGSPSAGDWLGERPEEPQLPLYVVSSDAPVVAVAFAQINARAVQFCGFQEEAGLVPGLNLTDGSYKRPPDWQSLLRNWKEAMERMGRAFREGEARVDPKNVNETCKYCGQASFCRKHEVLLYGGEENGTEE